MDYSLHQDSETGIITAVVTGAWSAQQDEELLREVIAIDTQGRPKLLLMDLRQLSADFSVSYIYHRAHFLEKRRERVEVPAFRAALIYDGTNPKVRHAYEFFETTAVNRGLPYRVFADIERARRWLMEA
jgi:hypothetical protein